MLTFRASPMSVKHAEEPSFKKAIAIAISSKTHAANAETGKPMASRSTQQLSKMIMRTDKPILKTLTSFSNDLKSAEAFTLIFHSSFTVERLTLY